MRTDAFSYDCAQYRFAIDGRRGFLAVQIGKDGGDLLSSPVPLLLCPRVTGAVLDKRSIRVVHSSATPSGMRRVIVGATLTGRATVHVINEFLFMEDRFVCNANCRADHDFSVAHWDITGGKGRINAETVHCYLLREGGPELNPGDVVNISTATHSRGFVPAPRVAFRCPKGVLVSGGTTVAHDFGMELAVDKREIKHWRFNYGGEAAPMQIAAGTVHNGPRLQMLAGEYDDFDQAHATFTQTMIDDGIVPEKKYLPEDDCWRRVRYCTWGDQFALGGVRIDRMGIRKDADGKELSRLDCVGRALTQEMVLRAAHKIREHKLDVGTIIIDEGWQDRIGDWNVDTRKFPDMRGLVDQLHAMDFKVVLWWSPGFVDPKAQVLKQTGFTCGPTPVHHEMVMDYTNPAVRKWAERKLDMWFSNGLEGWDIDALKVDFIAERIYPQTNTENEWRGEERILHHIYRMITDVKNRYKAGPGTAVHAHLSPHLAQYSILGHWGGECFAHKMNLDERELPMVRAMIPGQWLFVHFLYHADLVPEQIRLAKSFGAVPEIGRLLSEDMTNDLLHQTRTALEES